LTPVQTISDITSEPLLRQQLASAYSDDVNNIDPWVGMLAEDSEEDALFGELVMSIMNQQFSDLRDGDRFYYEIDPGLSVEEIQEIKNTRLYDIIMRNTALTDMPEEVFFIDPDLVSKIESGKEIQFEMVTSPNPTTGRFIVDFEMPISVDGELSISTTLGQVIHRQEVSLITGRTKIPLSLKGYPAGIYHAIFKMDDSIKTLLVVKR